MVSKALIKMEWNHEFFPISKNIIEISKTLSLELEDKRNSKTRPLTYSNYIFPYLMSIGLVHGS